MFFSQYFAFPCRYHSTNIPVSSSVSKFLRAEGKTQKKSGALRKRKVTLFQKSESSKNEKITFILSHSARPNTAPHIEKLQNSSQKLSLSRILKFPISISLSPSLPNTLPCIHHTFVIGTSGHSLSTFITVNVLLFRCYKSLLQQQRASSFLVRAPQSVFNYMRTCSIACYELYQHVSQNGRLTYNSLTVWKNSVQGLTG